MSNKRVSAMNQKFPYDRAELWQYQRFYPEICVVAHAMETTSFGQKTPIDSEVGPHYICVCEVQDADVWGVCTPQSTLY